MTTFIHKIIHGVEQKNQTLGKLKVKDKIKAKNEIASKQPPDSAQLLLRGASDASSNHQSNLDL